MESALQVNYNPRNSELTNKTVTQALEMLQKLDEFTSKVLDEPRPDEDAVHRGPTRSLGLQSEDFVTDSIEREYAPENTRALRVQLGKDLSKTIAKKGAKAAKTLMNQMVTSAVEAVEGAVTHAFEHGPQKEEKKEPQATPNQPNVVMMMPPNYMPPQVPPGMMYMQPPPQPTMYGYPQYPQNNGIPPGFSQPAFQPQFIPNNGIPSGFPQAAFQPQFIPNNGIPFGYPQAAFQPQFNPNNGIPSGFPQPAFQPQFIPNNVIPSGYPQAAFQPQFIPNNGIPSGFPQTPVQFTTASGPLVTRSKRHGLNPSSTRSPNRALSPSRSTPEVSSSEAKNTRFGASPKLNVFEQQNKCKRFKNIDVELVRSLGGVVNELNHVICKLESR